MFEPILEFLKKEKPDILAVQEAYNGRYFDLEKRLRSIDVLKGEFSYEFFSPACIAVLKEGKFEAGNAIFSNLPIIETNTAFFEIPFGEVANYETPGSDFSLTPRNLQHAVIKAEDTNLNVFNTQGIWGKDSEDNERRLKMSEAIVKKIRNKENVILAGDFNVMPHTRTVFNIEQHLTSVFKDKVKTTFNLKQKSNPGLADAAIDMVFVSNDLKIIDSYCSDVNVSDHLPLVCIFGT